ncbi:MAG: zinc-ribbon domain-containing protein [Nitrososphaerota archaeon]|nr:zinc-ribbon domain-containing protein [Nitrososphaerota archaeon]
MFCRKCGAQLSDDSMFCNKCGTAISGTESRSTSLQESGPEKEIVAPFDAKILKCPICGAPISLLFGEMVI